jgi:hypothetical protein
LGKIVHFAPGTVTPFGNPAPEPDIEGSSLAATEAARVQMSMKDFMANGECAEGEPKCGDGCHAVDCERSG